MTEFSVDVAEKEAEAFEAMCDALDEGEYMCSDVLCAVAMMIVCIMDSTDTDRGEVFKDLNNAVDHVIYINNKASKH